MIILTLNVESWLIHLQTISGMLSLVSTLSSRQASVLHSQGKSLHYILSLQHDDPNQNMTSICPSCLDRQPRRDFCV